MTDQANPTPTQPTEKRDHRFQVANRCVHFSGIQHDFCRENVNYRTLVGGDDFGWATRLPCLRDRQNDEKRVSCERLRWPTEQEIATEIEGDEKAMASFLENLRNSVCQTCKKAVKQRQVGHCVYGTCGHRLYQGKVNPKFAEERNA